MKVLFIASLLFILSCENEVDIPVIPQSKKPDSEMKTDHLGNFYVYSNFRVNAELSAYVISSTTNIYANGGITSANYQTRGQSFILNDLGQIIRVNNTTAVEGYVLAGDGKSFTPTKGYAKISFGSLERKSFNNTKLDCKELIINREKTGLYVLSPD